MSGQPTRRRFTVAEYHAMAKAGILTEDDRVELIDGEIVEMVPIDWRHHSCMIRLDRLFAEAFGPTILVNARGPLQLNDLSEVTPDIVVLRSRPDEYKVDPPKIEDVLLVVEVGDSITLVDRQMKAPLYARSGIPKLWLVDLDEDAVKVFRDPTPEGYRTTWTARRGDRIAPLAFPAGPIAVAEILG
jgi:Uma2 family endonuclease